MRSLRFILIFVGICGCLCAEEKRPLTYHHLSELVRLKLPDQRLAIEINDRRIDPLLTWKEARNLQDSGAGPETRKAIQTYLEPSPLILSTHPPVEGLHVTIAHQTYLTDTQGHVTVSVPAPGDYMVTTELPPAYPATKHIINILDEGARNVIELTQAPGRLSVLIEKASISIGSVGTYNAPIKDMALPAGIYEVSVESPNHLPFKTSVRIEPGLKQTVTPKLIPNPDILVAELQKMVSGRRLADVQKFQDAATLAMDAGADELFSITLLHHHSGRFHKALLTVGRSGIIFDPLQGPCTWEKELIPANRLKEVGIIKEGTAGVLLHIIVASGKNLTSQKQLNFAVQGSSFRKERKEKTARIGSVSLGSVGTMVTQVWSPAGAEDTLLAIAWLLHRIHANALYGSTPGPAN